MEHVTINNLKDPVCQYADFNAEILLHGDKSTVLIHGQSGRSINAEAGKFSRRFTVGDEAEYDSYNLRYTGRIVSITRAGVNFTTSEGRKRLSWVNFIRRNWDFDAKRVAMENDSERMCI